MELKKLERLTGSINRTLFLTGVKWLSSRSRTPTNKKYGECGDSVAEIAGAATLISQSGFLQMDRD